MTLRTRLFVTSGLIAVPVIVALFLIDDRFRLASMEETLQRGIELDLATGLRARCETGVRPSPGPPAGRPSGRPPGPPGGRPPGPPPGPPAGSFYRLFTYAEDGRSDDVAAPELPAASVSTFRAGFLRGIQIRFDIGGAGRCAVGLARMPPRPGQLRDQLAAVSLAAVAMLAGVWLAVGPVISRMRRLADDVRRSAASTYDQTVRVEKDDELAALARAFNEAGATVRQHFNDVQAREQTLRQFVADTTHDVAMPITVLQGHLSSLDARLAAVTGDPEDARRDLHAAVKEVHYMASLLRNLAVATKLGETSAPLVLAPVDVGELVDRVVQRHQPLARASGVALDFAVPEAPVRLHTDATLLEQAVSNLTDNAIRYNRAGGHVAVVLDASGPGAIALTVTDDGPGVSADELSSLTVRWFRGSDARTRRPDGKGLGLAIAAEACERLGLTLVFRRPDAGGLEATIAAGLDGGSERRK